MANNKDPRRNESGCMDLTAYEAIKKMDKNERNKEVFTAIKLVKNMLRKFDLIVINRIEVKDKRTNKVYR